MSKYVDADKLIALIDTKLEDLGLSGSVWVGRSVLQDLKNDIITSLQQKQPEVDLEREIIKYKVPFSDDREYLNEQTLDAIARHFYDIGFNAKNKV